MSTVYYSAKNAFSSILEDISQRVQKDHAIYGTGSTILSIITDSRGERPNCSTKGPILESDLISSVTGRDGAYQGRNYTLVEAENYSELLQNATRDDLYLFTSLANPNILNDEAVRASFYDRLSAIQKNEIIESVFAKESTDELRQTHSSETAKFDDLFGLVEGAVEVPQHHAFYAKGHEEAPAVQPTEEQ